MSKPTHNHCWFSSPGFDPKTGIPDLSGRVCLVTGANSGLGEATVTALAQHNPGLVYMAARSRVKAEEALTRIRASSMKAAIAKIEIIELDLASFSSIKAAAARFNQEASRLDLLHLNGGIAMVPPETTVDGYEIQFGTNYLGHALLTQLLMPKMLSTASLPGADVRIVAVSSVGHKLFAPHGGIVFEALKSKMSGFSASQLYAQSMLAKTLFSYELAKRYPSITSTSLHPGTVKSGVWNGDKNVNWLITNAVVKPLVAITGVSNEEGAKTQLWCSFSADVTNGTYYEPIGKAGKESKLARDDELSQKLWKWTEEELKASGTAGWLRL